MVVRERLLWGFTAPKLGGLQTSAVANQGVNTSQQDSGHTSQRISPLDTAAAPACRPAQLPAPLRLPSRSASREASSSTCSSTGRAAMMAGRPQTRPQRCGGEARSARRRSSRGWTSATRATPASPASDPVFSSAPLRSFSHEPTPTQLPSTRLGTRGCRARRQRRASSRRSVPVAIARLAPPPPTPHCSSLEPAGKSARARPAWTSRAHSAGRHDAGRCRCGVCRLGCAPARVRRPDEGTSAKWRREEESQRHGQSPEARCRTACRTQTILCPSLVRR